MNKYKFKFNSTIEAYSRVLLKSNGKDRPYQNELILTPCIPTIGYPDLPETMEAIQELNFVKYFHHNQPKTVSYVDELPEDVVKRIKDSVSEKMFDLLMNFDFDNHLIHDQMPSGFVIQAKVCLREHHNLLEGINHAH